jgi:hypothetical protein
VASHGQPAALCNCIDDLLDLEIGYGGWMQVAEGWDDVPVERAFDLSDRSDAGPRLIREVVCDEVGEREQAALVIAALVALLGDRITAARDSSRGVGRAPARVSQADLGIGPDTELALDLPSAFDARVIVSPRLGGDAGPARRLNRENEAGITLNPVFGFASGPAVDGRSDRCVLTR